jgi:YD repeat-containing protein
LKYDGVVALDCSKCTADKRLVQRVDNHPVPPGETPKGPFLCYQRIEDFGLLKPSLSSCSRKDARGNPIYPGSGTKREIVDLGVKVGDFKIAIGYDSRHVMPIAQVIKRTLQAQGTFSTTQAPEPSSSKSLMTTLGFSSPLGSPAWSMNLNKSLRIVENGAIVYAMRGDGSVVNFIRQADGSYPSTPEINIKLLDYGNGNFKILDFENGKLEAYEKGKLIEFHDKKNLNYGLTFSDGNTPASVAPLPNLLISIKQRFEEIQFRYTLNNSGSSARLSEVIDIAGNSTFINYDSNENLEKIQWPDGSSRRFLYQNPNFKWALTGVVDENNSQYSKFGYDSNGKAISTEHTNLVQRYSVNYSNQPAVTLTEVTDHLTQKFFSTYSVAAPTSMQLTMPTGAVNTINYTNIRGQNFAVSESQPAGSGCAASASATTYDSNANVTSRDDFTGKRTCFVNDLSRNVQTTRVEGLSSAASCASVTPANATLPAGARKISTQWHPNWRLPIRVAEPGKITSYIYNGQPDPTAGNAVINCQPGNNSLPNGFSPAVLCKKVEVATSDSNGSKAFSAIAQTGVTARVWQWTYDGESRVVSEDGPRTDVSDITTYAYHDTTNSEFNFGDLKTVTNAAGRVTQYTKYNKHGQLLESIDPNGVVSSFTYDLRQRMLSSTLGGQTTSYTYDPVGQLKRITRPDTSWVGYDYDGAHRLIAAYDNLGNRVDYTLDNAGNKTAENVKDPAGVLRKQLARSIDALGRVQQTSGRE